MLNSGLNGLPLRTRTCTLVSSVAVLYERDWRSQLQHACPQHAWLQAVDVHSCNLAYPPLKGKTLDNRTRPCFILRLLGYDGAGVYVPGSSRGPVETRIRSCFFVGLTLVFAGTGCKLFTITVQNFGSYSWM